jgi:hypothetical protein
MPSSVKAINMDFLCQHLVASSLSYVPALWKVTDPLTEETTFAGTVLALHYICTVLYLYRTVLYCIILVLYCNVLFIPVTYQSHYWGVKEHNNRSKRDKRTQRSQPGGEGGSFYWCTRFVSQPGHRLSWLRPFVGFLISSRQIPR